MRRSRLLRQVVAIVMFVPLAVVLAGLPVATAQEKEADQTKAAAKAGRKVGRKAAKPRGRLPAYYGQVVTEDQRQQIYAIQAKHAEKIKDLQTQLRQLKQAIAEEIEAVLSGEQKQQVIDLVAAAKAKRKATAPKAKKSADAKPSAQ